MRAAGSSGGANAPNIGNPHGHHNALVCRDAHILTLANSEHVTFPGKGTLRMAVQILRQGGEPGRSSWAQRAPECPHRQEAVGHPAATGAKGGGRWRDGDPGAQACGGF